MIVLGLEFSSPRRSAGLFRRVHPQAPPEMLATAFEEGARDATPLILVQRVLDAAAMGPEQVEAIVVGLGPGSYTGIRAGIALAQGWQLARPIRTVGVSTVECLALQAQANAWFGPITIAIDAQRNEFYLANYELTPTERRVVNPLRLALPEEFRAHASRSGELLIGPEITKWCESGKILFPPPASLVQLAPLDGAIQGAERLQPIYLRETTFVKAPPPRAKLA